MTPGKGDPFERAEKYARKAREHRAQAAAFTNPRDVLYKRRHQRDAVQLESFVRSIANGLIHLARIEAEEPHPPTRHCMCAACRPSFE